MAKGGAQHRSAQETICRFFRASGCFAVIEGCIDGHKLVDVLVFDPQTKRRTAVEFQTGRKNALRNIYLNFKAGCCDRVMIVCADQKVLGGIKAEAERILDAYTYSKVTFRLLEDFIP